MKSRNRIIRQASILFLSLATYPCSAQINGPIKLGQAQEISNTKSALGQINEIKVTSMGETPEAAEKQAITDAVRQAVGAYIDSDTLTQNEEVIQDRILTLSSGFVKNYRVTTPAHNFQSSQ